MSIKGIQQTANKQFIIGLDGEGMINEIFRVVSTLGDTEYVTNERVLLWVQRV